MNKLIIACIPENSTGVVLSSQRRKVEGISVLINSLCMGISSRGVFICGVNPDNPVLWAILAQIKPAAFNFLDLIIGSNVSGRSNRETIGAFSYSFYFV